MGKKNKKDWNDCYYDYDERRIDEVLKKANLDITNLDENGDPYTEDPRYAYSKKVERASAEDAMPSYDMFVGAKKKNKKKKKSEKRMSLEGDYDLIAKSPKNLENFIKSVASAEEKHVGTKKDIDVDPFDFIHDDATDGEEFQFDAFDPTVYDYTDDTPEVSDKPFVAVPGQSLEQEPLIRDESDQMVAEKYAPELLEEDKRRSYYVVSDMCSIHFNFIEPLERFTIDDKIAPSSYSARRIRNIVEQEDVEDLFPSVIDIEAALIGLCVEEKDGGIKFSETLYTDTIHSILRYILLKKHPAAIFTEEQFYEGFKNLTKIDTKAFYLFADANRGTPYVYGYYISPKERRNLNNFLTVCKRYVLEYEDFMRGDDYEVTDDERNKYALLLSWIYLAIGMTEDSAFDVMDESYIRTFIQTYVISKDPENPDDEGDRLPAFNLAPLYLQLAYENNKSVSSEQASSDEKDIDERLSVYEWENCCENGEDILAFVRSSKLEDDEDEHVSAESYDAFDPSVDESEEDIFEELNAQVNSYVESDIDFAAIARTEQSSTAVAKSIYVEYCKTYTKEHPGMNPPSFDKFLEDPNFSQMISSMTFTQNVVTDVEEDEIEEAIPIPDDFVPQVEVEKDAFHPSKLLSKEEASKLNEMARCYASKEDCGWELVRLKEFATKITQIEDFYAQGDLEYAHSIISTYLQPTVLESLEKTVRESVKDFDAFKPAMDILHRIKKRLEIALEEDTKSMITVAPEPEEKPVEKEKPETKQDANDGFGNLVIPVIRKH